MGFFRETDSLLFEIGFLEQVLDGAEGGREWACLSAGPDLTDLRGKIESAQKRFDAIKNK